MTTSDALSGDGPGSGIFRQVADTLVDLTRAARTGADPEAIRIAHTALRDQWEAAANDATEAGAGSVDRFETVAAALCVDAYRPALESLSLGRDATRELETARDALRCLIRARDAFVEVRHGVGCWLERYRSTRLTFCTNIIIMSQHY